MIVRSSLKALLVTFACFLFGSAATAADTQTKTLVLVIGATGEAEFATNFNRQASLWQNLAHQAGCRLSTLGLDLGSSTNDHDQLQHFLETEPKEGPDQLWLVFIGHGTFDGKEARFNLRGPDVSATELAGWLQPFRRPLAVINTSSSSAPFLNKLSKTNRVIITATRSGNEQNFARLGHYFAEAITGSEADLDKDGQVSLLEAFLLASRQALEFYKVEGRLATEHALLDDNGDGLGTPADWFRGLRAVKKPKDSVSVDGVVARQWYLLASDSESALSAEQRVRRDELERAILLYREEKGKVPDDQYYRELEQRLLNLARFYESAVPGHEPDKQGPQRSLDLKSGLE